VPRVEFLVSAVCYRCNSVLRACFGARRWCVLCGACLLLERIWSANHEDWRGRSILTREPNDQSPASDCAEDAALTWRKLDRVDDKQAERIGDTVDGRNVSTTQVHRYSPVRLTAQLNFAGCTFAPIEQALFDNKRDHHVEPLAGLEIGEHEWSLATHFLRVAVHHFQ
jgi:hypothetical protein